MRLSCSIPLSAMAMLAGVLLACPVFGQRVIAPPAFDSPPIGSTVRAWRLNPYAAPRSLTGTVLAGAGVGVMFPGRALWVDIPLPNPR